MEVKQVIVIRKDLKCRRGKEISQGCHASLGALLSISYTQYNEHGENSQCIPLSEEVNQWVNGNFKKICLQVESEEELLKLYNEAKSVGLISFLTRDAGLTEFGGVPTYTTMAIGPADSEKIDKITGHLKLY
jgi:PTH2 family peptidyl-tRNA hydrolase